MINNRQAGRRRGRGNNNGGGNGGGGGQRQGGGGGGQGARDTGNRIDSRARGNATQLYEKYKNLARDAQMQGDRVNIEYYLQFADHYFRVLSEQRTRLEESQPQHAPRPRIQQPFDINGDDDYADEGEPIRAGEQQGDQGGQGNGQGNGAPNGQSQNAGPRQDRDDRPRYDSQRSDNRQRDGQREDRPRSDRQGRDDRGARDEQTRSDARDDQSRNTAAEPQQREARGEYRDAPVRAPRAPRMAAPVQADDTAEQPTLPMSVATPVNDQGDTPDVAAAATEDKPRRRGRPPRDRSAEDATGAIADADRLPASFGISAAAAPAPAPAVADGEGEEKPRRRRIRTAASEVQAG